MTLKTLFQFALVVIICSASYVAGNLLANHYSHKDELKESTILLPSIVRLVRDGKTFCSGTVIEKNLIVTAAHCVAMGGPFGIMLSDEGIEIRPPNNEETFIKAKPVYATTQMDQALLEGDFSAFETRAYITDPAQLTALRQKGKGFVSCGYPLRGNIYCTTETFRAQNNFFWAVDGVLLPGMSGGPVMVGGVVVGVNTAVEGDSSIVSPIYNVTQEIKDRK